jgi:hypothetical protein
VEAGSTAATLPEGLGEYGLFLVVELFDCPVAIVTNEAVKTAIDKVRVGTFIGLPPPKAGKPSPGD